MDFAAIINDVIGFIESLVARIQEFLDSVVKVPGYTKPENYPDDFQPTAE